MKNLLLLITTITVLASCSKSSSNSGPSSTTFEASINGTKYIFTVETSHLLRSTSTNEKRLDFSGTSADGTKKLIITFGEASSAGNGISRKSYKIQLFNDDNPATPQDESIDSDDGFLGLGLKVSNNWVFGVYSELGTMTISDCNENAKTISGTFQADIIDLNSNTTTKITAGKFTNLQYIVLN